MSSELTKDRLDELAKRFGDGFYLLDSDVFEYNYLRLSKSFNNYYKKFNIAYSYKTNYIPKLVKIVNRLGGYAEVVSDMELEIALKSGVDYNRIIWNGPIKNLAKVEEVLLNGGTVNIDSVQEAFNISEIARNHNNNKLNVGIRCNYEVGDGVLSRFGIDTESGDFDLVMGIIASNSNLHLNGLQVHFAKRLPKYWDKRTEEILKLYDRVKNQYNIKLERIDIGGGMYGSMPESLRKQLNIKEITYEDYAVRAAKTFSSHFKNEKDAPELIVEPGSALAGNCMRFVCKIETIKEVRGKAFATVYGSQKNISMTGINPPIEIVSSGNAGEEYEKMDIVGYTCIEGDIIQKDFKGRMAVGDYVVVNNCGSYSIVMKPPFILPNFPIIDISEKEVEVIKRAESFDDLLKSYSYSC